MTVHAPCESFAGTNEHLADSLAATVATYVNVFNLGNTLAAVTNISKHDDLTDADDLTAVIGHKNVSVKAPHIEHCEPVLVEVFSRLPLRV